MGRSVGFKIVIAMMAFAANSVLCRIALKGEHIDPVTFSDLRLMSGAVVLLPLLLRREGKKQGVWSLKSGFFLMAYALCFSLAYIHLDTGTGALLLFGVVQLAMVAHGLFHGERLSFSRATGLGLAVAGMAALLLPGAKAPPLCSAVLMALSVIPSAESALLMLRRPLRQTSSLLYLLPWCCRRSLARERTSTVLEFSWQYSLVRVLLPEPMCCGIHFYLVLSLLQPVRFS